MDSIAVLRLSCVVAAYLMSCEMLEYGTESQGVKRDSMGEEKSKYHCCCWKISADASSYDGPFQWCG